MVDDIDATKAELEGRGATFDGDIVEDSFGRLVMMRVPGASSVMVYQASHPTAYDL